MNCTSDNAAGLSPEILAPLVAELPRLEKLVLYEFSNPNRFKPLQRDRLAADFT